MYFPTPPLNIIDRPADARHTSGKRVASAIKGIVLHDTGSKVNEDFYNTIYWLTTNSASDVSAHRFVDYTGQLYKLADDLTVCNHVGFSRWGNNTGLNEEMLGIELFRRPNDIVYPTVQIQATARQCVEWYGLYGPLAIQYHAWIDTKGKVDPRNFPWHQFSEYFYFYLYEGLQLQTGHL
jgi:N-acetyl-anhydromuramyl-L-alanine amidase AmpD